MKPCREYAMNYISRYPKTKKELSIKLYQKGYSSEQVEKTIQFLEEQNFVNDRMFAESYINSEVIKKGKPLFLIKQKLFMKGVDKEILDEVSQENEEDIHLGTIERIKKEIKKYKQKGVEGFDIIQKIMKRGYKLDDIKQAIQERNEKEK